MATKNIVPRANNEGGIGTSAKRWANGYFTDINASGDLSVAGTITGDVTGDVTGNVTGDLTGNVTGNVTGDVTGNADTATNATNATNDGLGNNIANTYQPAVVGAVIAFAGSTSPAGWLLCDGSAISRTQYNKLFGVIGTTYGAGDGTDTFNLPNLIDKFVEGSATAGTEHSAGLPNITGTLVAPANGGWEPNLNKGLFASGAKEANYRTQLEPATSGFSGTQTFDASRANSIYGASNTVQPPAVTMRYIIKY
jgi:microcystin-dependent protein